MACRTGIVTLLVALLGDPWRARQDLGLGDFATQPQQPSHAYGFAFPCNFTYLVRSIGVTFDRRPFGSTRCWHKLMFLGLHHTMCISILSYGYSVLIFTVNVGTGCNIQALGSRPVLLIGSILCLLIKLESWPGPPRRIAVIIFRFSYKLFLRCERMWRLDVARLSFPSICVGNKAKHFTHRFERPPIFKHVVRLNFVIFHI